MIARSVEQWLEILGDTDATHCSAEEAVSRRILADLVGFRHTVYEDDDIKQLANALQAYARMLQTHGVTA